MGLGRKSLKSPHFYEHSSAMPIIIQRENIFTSQGNITSVRDCLLPILGFHGATVPKVQSARPTSHGTNPIQDENGPIFQQTQATRSSWQIMGEVYCVGVLSNVDFGVSKQVVGLLLPH